jgi:hypothetical protein
MLNSSVYFYMLCLPIRILLSFLVYKMIFLDKIKYIGLVIGIGFLVLFFGGYRQNAFEATDGITWWKNYRLVHGVNYLTFFYLATNNPQYSWVPLFFDVIIGFLAKLIST